MFSLTLHARDDCAFVLFNKSRVLYLRIAWEALEVNITIQMLFVALHCFLRVSSFGMKDEQSSTC